MHTETPTCLHYGDLVEAYYENLHASLRSFRGGPDFLETWAHDEDHGRSLLSILDLAHAAGKSEIHLQITQEIAEKLNINWLCQETKTMGALRLENAESQSWLHFHAGQAVAAEDALDGISPAYREALRAAQKLPLRWTQSASHAFRGEAIWHKAECNGIRLHLAVAEDNLIVSAFHENATGVFPVLLDLFLDTIVNLPLQEAAEHGVIRLENSLRAANQSLSAKGVLTPENADPCFLVPQQLIRDIFSRQPTSARNTWRPAIPAYWQAASDAEKLDRVRQALAQALVTLALPDPGATIVEIKNGTRFVVAYPSSEEAKGWHHHLIRLEREMRRTLQIEAELQCEDLKDRNRRIERTQRALES